jgi:hypothetical protein
LHSKRIEGVSSNADETPFFLSAGRTLVLIKTFTRLELRAFIGLRCFLRRKLDYTASRKQNRQQRRQLSMLLG